MVPTYEQLDYTEQTNVNPSPRYIITKTSFLAKSYPAFFKEKIIEKMVLKILVRVQYLRSTSITLLLKLKQSIIPVKYQKKFRTRDTSKTAFKTSHFCDTSLKKHSPKQVFHFSECTFDSLIHVTYVQINYIFRLKNFKCLGAKVL